jgi:tetratricopeptide (TPR) repeat protein
LYELALTQDPRSAVNHRNIADVYRRLGREQTARAEYARAIALGNEAMSVNPRDAATIGLIALCEAKIGRSADAVLHAAEAVAVDSTNFEPWQRSAEVHAILNHTDAALRDLAIAVARGFQPRMARRDDELRSLFGLARFDELLKHSPGNADHAQGGRR